MIEVKMMAEPTKDSDEQKKKDYEEWELECKARTLMEAAEIKQDEKLMAALQPYLEKKVNAIKSISDLRKVAGKFKEKS